MTDTAFKIGERVRIHGTRRVSRVDEVEITPGRNPMIRYKVDSHWYVTSELRRTAKKGV